MNHRVVITGLGIIAPNANSVEHFESALRQGISGIRHHSSLQQLNFLCQVAGTPQGVEAIASRYFSEEQRLGMNSSMMYASVAAVDCWRDAGFEYSQNDDHNHIDWTTGAIIGTGIGGMDTIGGELVPGVDAGRVRRLGSTMVEQIMASASSAKVGGLLGLGGQLSNVSSACSSGTEAIASAFYALKNGRACRFLAGGVEGASPYIWGGFDAMRVLVKGFNEAPEKASRPMSASASGFVPSAGAGLLMLETLESAEQRGARIYAEILSASVNCGGQRQGGSMTAPNPLGVQRCIQSAIEYATISPSEIDAINGHLTGTMADKMELKNWATALGCKPNELPWINSTKSLIGHSLGAAGGLEAVASVLQLNKGFIHGSLNCEDIHPELEVFQDRIVQRTQEKQIDVLAKASFGFGDVNACLILKRWQ
ncbi:beta-ketoacyl-[acyl-carrier-protein] synthase family protein [Coxiella burnetii]|uniref:beta-ketoacyl-[acyl-carrier-protein] synthase family protein n=1 Tax=Coxiella burnetii TaxID=777 RepID=UPI000CCC7E73|nr:beta-ketoacyl-[acyl-carrier-protein] synthase family protein [Coxiella burnetii]PNT87360.1 beta-ketoacyl-ACP synthase [Coxiella burnetii]